MEAVRCTLLCMTLLYASHMWLAQAVRLAHLFYLSIMEKVVSYKKLSKKAKRKIDLQKRNTWGSLNPVTRNTQNPKAYKRARVKAQNRKDLEQS